MVYRVEIPVDVRDVLEAIGWDNAKDFFDTELEAAINAEVESLQKIIRDLERTIDDLTTELESVSVKAD